MGLLTDDIAAFTQVAAPSEKPAPTQLDIILKNCIDKHNRRITDANAVIEMPPSLPVIHGYSQMLSLLFHNLLSNALLFHKPGVPPKIRITYASTRDGDLPGHKLARAGVSYHNIAFQDNGVGFEPEYSEKIFGMFQRLHTQDAAYKGTGMGLAICKKVAEAHHGFIIADSVPGTGATFSCYLQDIHLG